MQGYMCNVNKNILQTQQIREKVFDEKHLKAKLSISSNSKLLYSLLVVKKNNMC